jgi:hypothetical protein
MGAISEEQGKRIIDMDVAHGGVQVVPRKEMKKGDLRVEYLTKDGDLIVHFFWEKPHPTGTGLRSGGEGFPDHQAFDDWPKSFRDVAWNALVRHFRLEERKDQIEVRWHRELYSYDATVKGIAMIAAPPDKLMEELISEISEMIS